MMLASKSWATVGQHSRLELPAPMVCSAAWRAVWALKLLMRCLLTPVLPPGSSCSQAAADAAAAQRLHPSWPKPLYRCASLCFPINKVQPSSENRCIPVHCNVKSRPGMSTFAASLGGPLSYFAGPHPTPIARRLLCCRLAQARAALGQWSAAVAACKQGHELSPKNSEGRTEFTALWDWVAVLAARAGSLVGFDGQQLEVRGPTGAGWVGNRESERECQQKGKSEQNRGVAGL